jgi:hypothetical protein
MSLHDYLALFRQAIERDGDLIFRYDNAVHRPALEFKEHKHIKGGVIIEAILPDVSDIMDEVLGFL